jgi:hypothetical protein
MKCRDWSVELWDIAKLALTCPVGDLIKCCAMTWSVYGGLSRRELFASVQSILEGSFGWFLTW